MRDIDYLPFLKYFYLKDHPAEMTFFVTNKCNALCSHCFYHKELNLKQQPLTPDEIGKIFSTLPRLLRIIFSGGEPFARKDLDEVILAITRATKTFHITIPTNGTLTRQTLDTLKRVLPLCPDTFINVGFSLDELNEKRDDILRLKGSFKNMMETWRQLKELKEQYSNLILGVVTTQTNSNQHNLEAIYKFATETMQVDNFAFSLIRTESYIPQELDVDVDIYRKMTKKIMNDNYKGNFKFSNLFVKKRNLLYDTVIKVKTENKYAFPCQSGRIRLVMSPTGELYPCEEYMLSGDPSKSFGNIKNYGSDFNELYKSETFKTLNDHIAKTKCFCRHECDLTTNLFFNPRMFLRMLTLKPQIQDTI